MTVYSIAITLRSQRVIKTQLKKKDFRFNTTPRERLEGHAGIAKRMLGIRSLQSRSNHFNFREMYGGDRWPGGLASLITSLNAKAKTASPGHESNPGRRGVTIAAQKENLAPTRTLTMTCLQVFFCR
jgi:hypothetical protein